MRSDRPYARAFVIQLGPDTDIGAGRLEGRVDHLASTRSARFRCLNELLAAMQQMEAESGCPDPDWDRET
jgi:hypothetical protein